MKRLAMGTALLLLSLLLAGATVGPMARDEAAVHPLAPDTAMQQALATSVMELIQARDEAGRVHAVEKAGDLAGTDAEGRVRLLQQLEIFLAGASGTEEAMGGALLLHALEFDRQEILAATLPYMVTAGPDLNKVLREVAATAAEDGRPDDPITLVLRAEDLRLGREPAATTEEEPESLTDLLTRLARHESRWVRFYAGAARSALPPRQ